MGDENLDKDKAKEAGGGQPKPPEALTPDQQERRDEAAEARQAATAGGPEAGLVDLGTPSATPTGPETGQPTWEPQPYPSDKGKYDPQVDPLVQRARVDPNPESFLDKPMGQQAREAIENIPRDEELRRLSGNLEAVAQQREMVEAIPQSEVKLGEATWRNVDNDQPVKITGDLGERDGRRYVSIEGSDTGIPLDEITYPEPKTEEPTSESEAGAPGSEPEAPKSEPGAEPVGGATPTLEATPDVSTNNIGKAKGTETTVGSDNDLLTKAKNEVANEHLDDDDWDIMDPEELKEEINELTGNIRTYRKALANGGLTPEGTVRLHADLDHFKEQKRKIKEVLRKKSGGAGENQDDEIRQRIDQETEDLRKYSAKTADELAQAADEVNGVLEGLQDRKDTSGDPKERAELDRRIRSEKSKLRTIDQLKGKKETKEGKQKEEEEKKKLEEDDLKAVEEAHERDRNLSNVRELHSKIEGNKLELVDLNQQIFDLEKKIEGLDPNNPERKKLHQEKIALSKKAGRINTALGLDESALKKARERAQAEDTGDFTRENVKIMPKSEYLGLKTEARADHLNAVSETLAMPSEAEARLIQTRMRNGEPISIDDKARMVSFYKDRFVRFGRRSMFSPNGVDIKAFNEMANRYPDVARATMNKVLENDAIKAQIQERFGSNWSKMIDYVKKNPAMFLLLLALLGIGTAAAIAGPVSTAAGLGKFAIR